MAYMGMDTTVVRQIGGHLRTQADDIARVLTAMNAIMAKARGVWEGPDAEQFVRLWNARYGPALETARQDLASLGKSAVANADEQDRVSAGGVASAGMSHGAGEDAGAAYVHTHPLHLSSDPATALRQWESLTPEQRDWYTKYDSREVGNASGIPVADRSAANLVSVQQDLDRYDALSKEYRSAQIAFLEGRETSDQLTELHNELIKAKIAHDNAYAVNEAIKQARQNGVEPYLWIYDPSAFHGDGRAALAYGNPDTADNTAVVVPGLMSTVKSKIGDPDGLTLYDQMARQPGAGKPSVVYYMGYDAPDYSNVASGHAAVNGAKLLAADIGGLQATHNPSTSSHVTVIGHSYGSTTVADAAAQDGMRVDDIVLIGSPGSGHAATASDLHVPSGHVYVGAASQDVVTGNLGVGVLGPDPSADDFGATRFHAESPNRGSLVEWDRQDVADHSRYFETKDRRPDGEPGESLSAMTSIANGFGLAPSQKAPPRIGDGDAGIWDPEFYEAPTWEYPAGAPFDIRTPLLGDEINTVG